MANATALPRSRSPTPYLYILPAFVVFAGFMLYPLVRAGQFSLLRWPIFPAAFVGFGNYVDLMGDERFLASFVHASC